MDSIGKRWSLLLLRSHEYSSSQVPGSRLPPIAQGRPNYLLFGVSLHKVLHTRSSSAVHLDGVQGILDTNAGLTRDSRKEALRFSRRGLGHSEPAGRAYINNYLHWCPRLYVGLSHVAAERAKVGHGCGGAEG